MLCIELRSISDNGTPPQVTNSSLKVVLPLILNGHRIKNSINRFISLAEISAQILPSLISASNTSFSHKRCEGPKKGLPMGNQRLHRHKCQAQATLLQLQTLFEVWGGQHLKMSASQGKNVVHLGSTDEPKRQMTSQKEPKCISRQGRF